MKRIITTPRPNWQSTVESQGFHFHSLDERPYWDESVYYQFTRQQIDAIEAATYALDKMCLDAVQHVIDQNLFDRFTIPPQLAELVRRSWERDDVTIYGRFDLAYDGVNPPKLLEYNADTPTSLLEAAVIQWFWMKEKFADNGNVDQFNSIHERLIEAWKTRLGKINSPVHFSSISGNIEDFMTVNYLRDTAMQAGLKTHYIEMERIGWNHDRRCFVDELEEYIVCCFKLYPWEWMAREQFGQYLLHDNTVWLEAPWKMVLSNKAILPVLYELFPNSPYILPAGFEPLTDSYVRKPLLSREGANIQMVRQGQNVLETDGVYGGPYIYQQLHHLPRIDNFYPLIGSWMVNGYACGIGIREDSSPVTGNTSRFVPHIFT